VIAVGRILQVCSLELVQQERHSFEAIAAVTVAAVGEKAHHRLVDLNSARRLRPIGGDGPLSPLRRDRARAIGDEKADQDLKRPRLGFARLFAGQSEEEKISHAPAAESFLPRYPAKAAGLVMAAGNGGADHDAVETQIPGQRFGGQTRDSFAHQRTPCDRGRNCRQNRIPGRPRIERFEELQEQ